MKTNRGITFATATGALLMSLLAFASTAAAEVVYTPVNVTISGAGSIGINLNHDKIKDLVLKTTIQARGCSIGAGFAVSTTITPKSGGGVVESQPHNAAVLGSGVSIDSSQTYSLLNTLILRAGSCTFFSKSVFGYLGLEIPFNGQTYYGWAHIGIRAIFEGGGLSVTTTLYDFAYESNPGQAIITGQTSGNLDEAGNLTPSIEPSFDKLIGFVAPKSSAYYQQAGRTRTWK